MYLFFFDVFLLYVVVAKRVRWLGVVAEAVCTRAAHKAMVCTVLQAWAVLAVEFCAVAGATFCRRVGCEPWCPLVRWQRYMHMHTQRAGHLGRSLELCAFLFSIFS